MSFRRSTNGGVTPYTVPTASPPSTPVFNTGADRLVMSIGKNASTSYLTYNSPQNIQRTLLDSTSGSAIVRPQDSVSQAEDRRFHDTPEKRSAAQGNSAEGSSQASGSSAAGRIPPPLPPPLPSPIPPAPPSPTPETRNVDSGLRFSSGVTPSEFAPLDAPPEYTPH